MFPKLSDSELVLKNIRLVFEEEVRTEAVLRVCQQDRGEAI